MLPINTTFSLQGIPLILQMALIVLSQLLSSSAPAGPIAVLALAVHEEQTLYMAGWLVVTFAL